MYKFNKSSEYPEFNCTKHIRKKTNLNLSQGKRKTIKKL